MNSNLMVVVRPAGVYKGRAVKALVWLACPKMATRNCQPHDYLASGPERHWRVNPSPNHSERVRFSMAYQSLQHSCAHPQPAEGIA